jgi:hypothetical protein
MVAAAVDDGDALNSDDLFAASPQLAEGFDLVGEFLVNALLGEGLVGAALRRCSRHGGRPLAPRRALPIASRQLDG